MWNIGGMLQWQEKQKYSRERDTQERFVYHKSHMDYTEMELGFEKPTTKLYCDYKKMEV
jgi:hypothetical protein